MSLRERREIVALCRDAGAVDGVLFTLVGVSGSSYRRPGARMVVLADGRTAGTLSGGCLEAELLRRAFWMVRNGAVVESFSTAFDDTAEVPYGLGCGGDVAILAEPLHTPEAAALVDALEATLRGDARRIVTVLPEEGAAVRHLERTVCQGPVLPMVERKIEEPFAQMYMEDLPAVQRMVIFGAGEDAKPLARVGAEMGFTVVVVDSRQQHARKERFPSAEMVLVAHSASHVPVRRDDAVVLMTHSYEQDRRLLTELLPFEPRYLGVLGARHRSALLLSEASELAGISLQSAVERTHAPVGLELGGDGPEAIALAIMAEVQQVLHDVPHHVANRRLTQNQATALLRDHSPVSALRETCPMYEGMDAR